MLGDLSDIDLRFLRVFLAVAEAGGISSAQWTLKVGQSTISTQLAILESRLGYRLCERGRGGFRLTAKGERFAELSRKLLSTIADFNSEARNLDKKLVGSLRIGIIGNTPMSENFRVSEAIARFRRRDEAVKFIIRVCPPIEMEEGLLRGDLDMAIGYFWHHAPTLHFTPLFTEHHLAYCGKGHTLFHRAGEISPIEASDHSWAWRTYPLPEAQMSASPRKVTATADNMEAVAMLVLSGHHLGFLPEHFSRPLVAEGLLAALNPKIMQYEVTLQGASRRRPEVNEITRAFLDDLFAAHHVTPPSS
ncbi:LysR family transcriptional regulator [Acidiphilium sp.]|uniref:LysR family transcriptional regulator n=1 Tax=Acidiphilium sp. TaxID=527 RepID=UPI003D09333C